MTFLRGVLRSVLPFLVGIPLLLDRAVPARLAGDGRLDHHPHQRRDQRRPGGVAQRGERLHRPVLARPRRVHGGGRLHHRQDHAGLRDCSAHSVSQQATFARGAAGRHGDGGAGRADRGHALAAAARRLPGHRHPRVRRDHPCPSSRTWTRWARPSASPACPASPTSPGSASPPSPPSSWPGAWPCPPTAGRSSPSARTRSPPRPWASTPPATRSAPSSSRPPSPGWPAG